MITRYPIPGMGQIAIYYSPDLRKPRLERETFSGGVNLSACARNRSMVKEASKCYLVKPTRNLYGGWTQEMVVVPSWLKPEFERQLEVFP